MNSVYTIEEGPNSEADQQVDEADLMLVLRLINL